MRKPRYGRLSQMTYGTVGDTTQDIFRYLSGCAVMLQRRRRHRLRHPHRGAPSFRSI